MSDSAARSNPAAKLLRGAPLGTIILFLAALAIQLLPEVGQALQYEADAIWQGEVWRLLTGHWTHFTVQHFAWNAAVFFGLGAVCEVRDRRAFLACTLLSALGIPAALLIAAPSMSAYRGLSGIDSALFMLAAMFQLRESARIRDDSHVAIIILFVVGFLFKTGFELSTHGALFVKDAAAMTPVPLAHLVGAAAGILCGARPFHDRNAEPSAVDSKGRAAYERLASNL